MSKKEIVVLEEDVDISELIKNSVDLVEYARGLASKQVNMIQLLTYYSIGKWIVDVQQKGGRTGKVRTAGDCFTCGWDDGCLWERILKIQPRKCQKILFDIQRPNYPNSV